MACALGENTKKDGSGTRPVVEAYKGNEVSPRPVKRSRIESLGGAPSGVTPIIWLFSLFLISC